MAKQRNPARETRETVIHSGLAGMAAGVVAAAMGTSTGAAALDTLGQAVGVELSGAHADEAAAAPLIAPFTLHERIEIRARIADSIEAIRNSREATDPEIEFMRSLAARPGLRIYRRPLSS
jgi:hypothetical protein